MPETQAPSGPAVGSDAVIPPGEMLWICHGSMFGKPATEWDDLPIAEKVRWAAVEHKVLEELGPKDAALASRPAPVSGGGAVLTLLSEIDRALDCGNKAAKDNALDKARAFLLAARPIPDPAPTDVAGAGEWSDLAKQVADQCRVVAHLATALARVHSDYAKVVGIPAFAGPLHQVGERSAQLMEMLGEALNNMDATSPDDEWVDPIFEEAQRLFPAREDEDAAQRPAPAGATGLDRDAVARAQANVAEYLRDMAGEPGFNDDLHLVAAAPLVPPDGGSPGCITVGDLRALSSPASPGAVEGETQAGATLTGPGSRPSDRTPSGFAPAGVDPSRGHHVTVNINYDVLVRLTDYGHELLARSPDESIGFKDIGNGQHRVQMWCLMRAFGSDLFNGCDVPFETEIELPDARVSNERPKAEDPKGLSPTGRQCDGEAGTPACPKAPAPDAVAGPGDGWLGIETAPVGEEVEVRAGAMTFLAKLVPDAAINTNEDPCDQWQATREGEHPPCWTDGACWTVNEDESASLWPTHWRYPALAAPAASGTGA